MKKIKFSSTKKVQGIPYKSVREFPDKMADNYIKRGFAEEVKEEKPKTKAKKK